MDDLITIIIPVYNARIYLEKCVITILSQTYTNLQIIFVNDGSTDGSGDICDEYAARDARVNVIHQENKGASAARNAGLNYARGTWIAFVDADDFISPYYIEDMHKAAGDNCDMVICRAAWVNNGNDDNEPFRRDANVRRITGREACMRNFGKDVILYNSVWGKLFKARLWEGLRFPEGKINEDMYISHALLYRAEYITIMEAVLYAYFQSEESVMRSAFSPKYLDILDAWQEAARFYNEKREYDLENIARRVYCSRVLDARCICGKLIPNEKETLRRLRLRAAEAYREAKPVKGYIDCNTLITYAYRIKLFIGRWSPPLYSFIFLRGRTYL